MISPQAVAAYMQAAPALDGLSREDAIMVVTSLTLLIPEPVAEPEPGKAEEKNR